MIFSDGTAAIGTGRIEVAKGYIVQSISTAELGQHHFDHQLGLTVDVGRLIRHVFRDRRLFRFAIDGSRRGKDEVLDLSLTYGFKELYEPTTLLS